MEKRQRRNRKIPTILVIICVQLFTLFMFFSIYLVSNIDKKYNINSIEKNIKEKEMKVVDLEIEEKVLLSKIDEYKDIDKLITEEKNNYYNNIKKLEDLIISGKSNRKIAYLTFDDGPYYTTYDFLNVLDNYNVKATFFVQSGNGQYCYLYKDKDCYLLYKEYEKRGHTIANHTYHHLLGNRYIYQSSDNFIKSVQMQEELIKDKSGGYVTNIVRFPGGSATAGRLKNEIIQKLREIGYGWVDWTANDGDGGGLYSSDQAWNNFVSTINENIEVVLFHDYNRYTLEILPRVIEYLRNRGYVLLPLFYESNMVNK